MIGNSTLKVMKLVAIYSLSNFRDFLGIVLCVAIRYIAHFNQL